MIGKRVISMIVVLIGVTIIAFTLVRLTPGNPAAAMLPDTATEEEVAAMAATMGLDKPYAVQYVNYLKGILKGDLGYSYKFGMPVTELIAKRLPQTAKLTIVALVVTVIFSISLGVISGIKKGSVIDVFSIFFSLAGQSVAPVWLSLMMILLFGVTLGWLPTQGNVGIKCMIMPAIALGFQFSALVTRMTRTGMVDVLQEDYITATRARGISKVKVYTIYALKNALLPVVTVVGSQVGHMLAGSAIVESVFGWPGMGQLLVTAINSRDLQLVQSLLLVSAFIIAIVNLMVDILYTFIDPRISFN
ncbi:MAG: ABC transporter permease [Hungatella hathewayi]|uniref:ABC transporter permease n=1 Tax=Hungatella TaxID=1649459 RepID=UPI001FAC512A|nr:MULTISPECIES: ABC transporter permease [Hungatella]MCI7380814.1 ABC transporter permease [Hungatella sp.]MDY6235809.1 ABC transporter permease [Hungatella hathewayi]